MTLSEPAHVSIHTHCTLFLLVNALFHCFLSLWAFISTESKNQGLVAELWASGSALVFSPSQPDSNTRNWSPASGCSRGHERSRGTDLFVSTKLSNPFLLKSIRTETSLWVTFYLRFPSQFLWAAFREDKTPGDWMDSLETISCRETAKGITTQDEPESTFTCFAGWHMSSPASCNYLGCLCLWFLLIKGNNKWEEYWDSQVTWKSQSLAL